MEIMDSQLGSNCVPQYMDSVDELFNTEEDIISTILKGDDLMEPENFNMDLMSNGEEEEEDCDEFMESDDSEGDLDLEGKVMKADCMWSTMRLKKLRSISESLNESEPQASSLNEISIDMSSNNASPTNNNLTTTSSILDPVEGDFKAETVNGDDNLEFLRSITLDHPYASLQWEGLILEDGKDEFDGVQSSEESCLLNMDDFLLEEEVESVETSDEEEEENESCKNDGDSQDEEEDEDLEEANRTQRLLINSKQALIRQMIATAQGLGNGKKTKILVPLKDLMETLDQHKSFQVTPIGPGKKVIKLTGGETVANVLTNVVNSSNGNLLNKISIIECKTSLSSDVSTVMTNKSPLTSSRPCSSALRQDILNLLTNALSENSETSSINSDKSTIIISARGGRKEKYSSSQAGSSTSAYTSYNSSPGKSSSSSSHNSTGTPSKKKTKPTKGEFMHNNSERQRRKDLRMSFEYLKILVPSISHIAKVPKVQILCKSEEYIGVLKEGESNYLKNLSMERKRNEMLKSKLTKLQS